MKSPDQKTSGLDFQATIDMMNLICETFDVSLAECDIDPVEYVITVRKQHRHLATTKFSSADFDLFCKTHGLNGVIFFEIINVPNGHESVVVFSMTPVPDKV